MRTYILSALCAMSALPAMVVASTQSFEVGPVWQGTPINGGNVFEFEITDPATNNSTDCIVEFASNSPPPGWILGCADGTFSFKIDSMDSSERPSGIITFEIKHQYRGAGKKCVKSNGPQCTTARAYLSLVYSDWVLSGDAVGNVDGEWAGPYNATIFSKCSAGCGLTSGLN